MFCWFPAAILVHQNGTPIWRLHTKLYKGAWNVSANNSETVCHKDLRLEQIVYKLVFYNIWFSWLLRLDGFQFIFCCVTVKTIYTEGNTQQFRSFWSLMAKKLMSHTLFVNFWVFKGEFLQNHSAHRAQIFGDNCNVDCNCYTLSIFRDFTPLTPSDNEKHLFMSQKM